MRFERILSNLPIIVFTFIVGTFVLAIVGVLINGCFLSKAGDNTYESAHEFASSMGEPDAKITCVSRDTDGDDYITCTIFGKKGPISIECATKWALNEGCKMPKFPVRQ